MIGPREFFAHSASCRILFAATLVFVFLSLPAWAITKQQLLASIVEKREDYLERYADRKGLLRHIENETPVLRIENTGPATVELEKIPFFYNLDKIKAEIGIQDGEPPKSRILKIFEFTRKRRKHAYPLHENKELHNPPRFFSVYGSGFCDDASSNLAYLAAHYGHQAKTWWLEGHVVTAILHDEKWRVYDADGFGIVELEGEVADVDAMVSLAKENKLPAYNELYATTENNRLTQVYPDFQPDDPRAAFLSHEKRFFYDRAYMLTNDGHYLEEFADREAFLKEYENIVANFVRIIPLKSMQFENGELVLEDYFPIAGAFVQVPFSLKQIDSEILPWIRMRSEFYARIKGEVRKAVIREKITAKETSAPGADYRYLDLSIGTDPLEPYPSRRITVGVSKGFLEKFEDASLITVHEYSIRNAQFDPETVENAMVPDLEIRLNENNPSAPEKNK